MTDTISVIDLFAGVGGIRLGFERAMASRGGKVDCGYACDIDRFARQTYRLRHPQDAEHVFGDVRATKDEIPDRFDVLLAGFPCQPFSLAGVSKKNSLGRAHGLEDVERGTLFDEIVDILEQHEPAAFLLENVKHLLGHDGGNTFRVIEKRLSDCAGGAYEWRVRSINSRTLVPQSRERVYFVGYRRDLIDEMLQTTGDDPERTLDWPVPPKHLEDGGERTFWFPHFEEASEEEELPNLRRDVLEDRPDPDPEYTLGRGTWEALERHRKHHEGRTGFGRTVVDPDTEGPTRTLSARYHKDGAEILIRQRNSEVPRRLTPRECARLMGFRDDEIEFDPDGEGVSRTQFYRQMGNSVVVDVIEKLAEHMVDRLLAVPANRRRSVQEPEDVPA